MIQVKTSTQKQVHGLTAEEYEDIIEFARFVKSRYVKSIWYSDRINKPIAFSVGLAKIKFNPETNRRSLYDTEFIKFYQNKIPQERVNDIKLKAKTAHSLK